jgi:hypothetical protein
MKCLFAAFAALLLGTPAAAFKLPPSYVCYRTATPMVMDGRLMEAAWQTAQWTGPFVDIEGAEKPPPRFLTRAKMLWDDHALYIAAQMEEPQVWATITKRDSIIFHDNDFEVFLDPDGDNFAYGELEINALNAPWDLFLPKPYKDGGHPNDAWTIVGLQSAVQIGGTLNNSADVDSGWTLEIALPWLGLQACSQSEAPPHEGEQWRVNFSRVEWHLDTTGGVYRKIEGLPEDNWVWSPQHVINMHRPETWGVVQFSAQPPGSVPVTPDPFAEARVVLHAIYYAQTDFFREHQHYANEPSKLTWDSTLLRNLKTPPTIMLTSDGFVASLDVRDADGLLRRATIRQDSHFTIAASPR